MATCTKTSGEMKTSNHFNNKVMQNFEKFFDKALINCIGKSSGFASRKAQKITAYHFVPLL